MPTLDKESDKEGNLSRPAVHYGRTRTNTGTGLQTLSTPHKFQIFHF